MDGSSGAGRNAWCRGPGAGRHGRADRRGRHGGAGRVAAGCKPGDRRKPAGAGGSGAAVFAGTLNLGEALTVRVTATGGGTLLAECARLIEAAEARRSRFVVLADRVARRYAPAVHVTALATFLWWYFVGGRAGRGGAADSERGADHYLPVCTGSRGAGGAGDRDGATVPLRRAAEVADGAGAAGGCRYDCPRQDGNFDRAGRWRWSGPGISIRRRCEMAASLAASQPASAGAVAGSRRGTGGCGRGCVEVPGQGVRAGICAWAAGLCGCWSGRARP